MLEFFKIKIISYLLPITVLLPFIACSGSGSGNGGSDNIDDNSWTIMYYVDADNDLEEALWNDLNEIESVDFSNKNIKVIALVDRIFGYSYAGDSFTDTRAYEVGYDSSGYDSYLNTYSSNGTKRISIPSLDITEDSYTELNMGDKDTLSKFISFCKSEYPAGNYMLLMSNHGGGWRNSDDQKIKRLEKIGIQKAICWDESSNNDSLYMKEVREAIEEGFGTNEKLDIIAFDACLMAMVEVAYELKDVADILVASEETIPEYGFPYTQIMNRIKDTTANITATLFSEIIVEEYYTAYTQGTNVEDNYITNNITLSAIDLSKMDSIMNTLNDLGAELSNTLPNYNYRVQTDSYAESDYVNVSDYCSKLSVGTNVINAINNAVIISKAGTDHSDAKGLALYYPKHKNTFNTEYSSENILFARDAYNWLDFLKNNNNPTSVDTIEFSVVTFNDYIYMGNDNANDTIAHYNNSIYTTSLMDTNAIEAYIAWENDQDYYLIPKGRPFGTTLTIDLTDIPAGCNYELILYGISSITNRLIELDSSENTSNSPETVETNSYTSSDYLAFFALIVPSNGFSTTDKYSISAQ